MKIIIMVSIDCFICYLCGILSASEWPKRYLNCLEFFISLGIFTFLFVQDRCRPEGILPRYFIYQANVRDLKQRHC